ncbi:hypothetical protein ACTMU2_05910 [Cupriavidus basilensis]
MGQRIVTLHDMTLRDGMHPKRHQISLEQMKRIARGLDAAGVPLDRSHSRRRPGRHLGQRLAFRARAMKTTCARCWAN